MVVTRVIHISIDDADDIIELASIIHQVLHEIGVCSCDPDINDCVEELV